MRNITENGLALIKRFEGFSAAPYLDVAGLKTIGFGHLIKPGEVFSNLTEAEAGQLLLQDLQTAMRAVHHFIYVPLTDGQYNSLVSFTFNVGAAALQRSTLRQKVNRCEHANVPREFERWVWAGGRKIKGLMKRRMAEARLYQT